MTAARCAVCGATVAASGAIDVPAPGGTLRCCSSRCADTARSRSGSDAPAALVLPDPPRRILVAVDGSGPSVRAVEQAVMLAKLSGGEVTLLYAIEPMGLRGLGDVLPPGRLGEVVREVEQALRDEAEAQLRRPRELCEAAGISYTVEIVFKLPVEAILEAATAADLVVLGSRGRGAVAGALFGSVSHRVIGAAQTPVLVVH